MSVVTSLRVSFQLLVFWRFRRDSRRLFTFLQLATTAQAIRNAKLKHTFLSQLAAGDAPSREERYKQTAEFVNTWLGSQSRDLEVMLGNERGPAMEGWSGDYGGVSHLFLTLSCFLFPLLFYLFSMRDSNTDANVYIGVTGRKRCSGRRST